MSVVLPVGQDERRIEIAFDVLEVVFNGGTLGGEKAIAESKHLDLFLWNMLKNRGRAVSRLVPTPLVAAKNDPSHVEAGISAAMRRMVPPQPISMSSEWAP